MVHGLHTVARAETFFVEMALAILVKTNALALQLHRKTLRGIRATCRHHKAHTLHFEARGFVSNEKQGFNGFTTKNKLCSLSLLARRMLSITERSAARWAPCG